MADKRRFAVFARFIIERFPAAQRIFDVGGGQGALNRELTILGREVLTFDRRRIHLDVPFVERELALDEPCACELVVGMHPDGATRRIIEYAARHRVPFAVVPCCSDNGMSYRPWMRHLVALARECGFPDVEEAELDLAGRARVIVGEPRISAGRDSSSPDRGSRGC